MDKSIRSENPLGGENAESEETELRNGPKRITHVAARLKLPETPRRKPRRQSPSAEAPARAKSEEELRAAAAWKQVEETGKPVVLEDTLLLPDGMNVTQAIQYLEANLREETAGAWGRQFSAVWGYIIKSTAEQIRQKAEEDGKLEYYNSLPPYARTALLESLIRQQWGYPEIPFEQLLEQIAS